MQKWDYYYVIAEGDTMREINGQAVKPGHRESVSHYINRAGAEGWEIVGICTASEGGGYWRIMFKRPKPNE